MNFGSCSRHRENGPFAEENNKLKDSGRCSKMSFKLFYESLFFAVTKIGARKIRFKSLTGMFS